MVLFSLLPTPSLSSNNFLNGHKKFELRITSGKIKIYLSTHTQSRFNPEFKKIKTHGVSILGVSFSRYTMIFWTDILSAWVGKFRWPKFVLFLWDVLVFGHLAMSTYDVRGNNFIICFSNGWHILVTVGFSPNGQEQNKNLRYGLRHHNPYGSISNWFYCLF